MKDTVALPAHAVELLRRQRAGNWLRAERPEDAECIRFRCPLGEPVNDAHTSHQIVVYVRGRVADRVDPDRVRCEIHRTKDGFAVRFDRAPGRDIGCSWGGPLLVPWP